ncbi:MAG: pirin family protein [Pseudomonadota bacterium]
MSYFAEEQAAPCRNPDDCAAIDLLIQPRSKDLGEFTVRRVLPASNRRMVGPFVFFDHMGPAEFAPGEGIQVRPHPHIGIATITYLFEGEIMHRDSLGFEQPIRPGAVNLMTAGRGIVHSERAGEDYQMDSRLHGIQSWIALPEADQEMAPGFVHYPAPQLPATIVDGVELRLIMGQWGTLASPVTTYSETLYAEAQLAAGSQLEIPALSSERALYLVSGSVQVDGFALTPGEMVVLAADAVPTVEASTAARLMVIGGAALGRRHLWWNFVSSSPDRIEQAKRDWAEGRFDGVAGDDEFIPLPEK